MLLSLSGFLFEDDYTTQSLSFEDFCRLAKAIGYDAVELRNTQIEINSSESEREEKLAIVKENGLFVSCLTARRLPTEGNGRDSAYRKYLELCKSLDCRLLKISGDTVWLGEAVKTAKKYDVILATNNHVGSLLETVAGTRQYFSGIAQNDFGLLYDAMHLMISGEDYLSCIEEFKPITKNILMHSARLAKEGESLLVEKQGKSWTIALPDEAGVQDWFAIFRRFKQHGYDGLITVIESGWENDKREFVARHCAQIVKGLWEEA